MMIKQICFLLLCLSALRTYAQAPEGGGGGGGAGAGAGAGGGSAYEAGLHTGFLLPNHIEGVTEIMALTGVRGALRFGNGFYGETGFMAGNGDGQQWKTAHIDGRLDFPVETLVAMAYFGLDMNYYSGPGISNTIAFGGHLGGGFKSEIGRNVWLRADMKFNGQPGTSLFFGFGVDIGFGAGGGG